MRAAPELVVQISARHCKHNIIYLVSQTSYNGFICSNVRHGAVRRWFALLWLTSRHKARTPRSDSGNLALSDGHLPRSIQTFTCAEPFTHHAKNMTSSTRVAQNASCVHISSCKGHARMHKDVMPNSPSACFLAQPSVRESSKDGSSSRHLVSPISTNSEPSLSQTESCTRCLPVMVTPTPHRTKRPTGHLHQSQQASEPKKLGGRLWARL
jgi:hypothetical protein